MSLCPGKRFNRYKIEEVLGWGGMGVVYRAHDPRLHRYVALKLLQTDWVPALGNTLARSVRVLREARAAASLDHPNAVSVFDVGEEDGQPFIAMELIVGKPLRAFVGDMSIPLQRRLRWLLDIARVLAAAHKRGLAHRDVKPENVMVRDDDVIKVLDFGIACESAVATCSTPAIPSPEAPGPGPHTSQAPAAAPLWATFTRGGGIEGTPLYMAPEQMRGEPADCRSDQFAWGVVAYELLTGMTPWRWSGSPISLLADMMRETPLLWGAAPELALPARDVVQRALAISKKDRFESMDRIVEALEPLLIHGPSPASAPPISVPARAIMAPEGAGLPAPFSQRFGQRRLATILAAGALAAAVVGGIAWRLGPARAQRAATSSAAAMSSAAPISPNPEAVQAFEEGMRAYNDSAVEPAIAAFERAVKLDPKLAAAHLRLGLYYEWHLARCADAREAFERANAARDRLNEHDRLILHAMPLFLEADPPDVDEIQRRLGAALERFPMDPELLLLRTWLYQGSGDGPQLLRSAERLIPLTP
ncbi:MAG TPA: serine/threonine-protein kinase, partial [Polyangiaceae bacterium]|nr:serine/threonine-protein kinase [Polyangiaceae bacterium]